ncbi:MAG TPA: hypothetical protein VIR03_03140 [Candidatus Saccharimonadales bacterium]
MRKFARAAALLLAVSTLISTVSVSAQSNGLGISPRKDYSIQPGKNISDTIYISNLSTTQDLDVELSLVDFGAQNETGAPALRVNDESSTAQTPWSLKPFIKLPSTQHIAAGKSVYAPISVAIPASQGAGSYYSAIQYKAVNPVTKQRVNIAASTATLVFVTVPGNAREQLIMKEFGAWQSTSNQLSGAFKGLYIGASPKELAYRFQNNGNIAEQPSGSILIKNMFGHNSVEIQDANPKRQLSLIGQTRRIQVCLKTSVLNDQSNATGNSVKQTICDAPGLMPGHYTAQIVVFYGLSNNNTQEIQATASFWYFPWWFIVGTIVVIIALVLLGWLIKRAFWGGGRRRRYRR